MKIEGKFLVVNPVGIGAVGPLPTSPGSTCAHHTAIESPEFADWKPIIGFASVCFGMLTCVHPEPTVIGVHVNPSTVMLMGPVTLIAWTNALACIAAEACVMSAARANFQR